MLKHLLINRRGKVRETLGGTGRATGATEEVEPREGSQSLPQAEPVGWWREEGTQTMPGGTEPEKFICRFHKEIVGFLNGE